MNTLIGSRTRLAFPFFVFVILSALVFLNGCAAPAAAEDNPSLAQVANSGNIPSAPEAVQPTPVFTATFVPAATLTPTQRPMNFFQKYIDEGAPDLKRNALLFAEPAIAELGFVPTQNSEAYRCPLPEHEGLQTIAYVGDNTVIAGNLGDREKYYGLAMMNPANCRYELVWAVPMPRGAVSSTEIEKDAWELDYNGQAETNSGKTYVDENTVLSGCTGRGSKPEIGSDVRYGYALLYDNPNGKYKTYIQWAVQADCQAPRESNTASGVTTLSPAQVQTRMASEYATSTADALSRKP